jgi:NAD(P)-dependent dehydrogenase (short-subunit alcohol dehydrogenase family)
MMKAKTTNAERSAPRPRKKFEFGASRPIGRPAQPEELAPACMFLASVADASYITGIVLPVMGGETIG